MQKIKNEELGRKTTEEFIRSEKLPVRIVLDNVRSLNNVGSAFRTADAFLLDHLYLCGVSGQPPHREIEKTALGATETVKWSYHPATTEAIQLLKQQGFFVAAVEQVKESVYLHDFDFVRDRPLALVFGNEVYGVEQSVIDLCDACIEIPQLGSKHSLNIAVSIGITVWQAAVPYLKNK